MPPCRAMAMAIRDSVTVSIALETSGTRRLTSRVSRVVVSTSLGVTSVSPGRRSTSSYVRPSGARRSADCSEGSGKPKLIAPVYGRRDADPDAAGLTGGSLTGAHWDIGRGGSAEGYWPPEPEASVVVAVLSVVGSLEASPVALFVDPLP